MVQRRMAEINPQNNRPASRVLTLREFCAPGGPWRAYNAEKSLKPSTLYSYESMLERFILPELGDRRIDQIQPDDITRLFGSVPKELAAKSRVNLYALLNVMFEVAVEYDLVSRSPVRRKLHRSKSERAKKVALSPEQLGNVLAKIPKEHRALFLCLAFTGLRIGEVLGLLWRDVDLESATLTVTHSLWRGRLGSPKTDASAAPVPLARVLVEAFKEHWRASDWTEPGDFVFCKLDGSPVDPDQLRKDVLYPALDAAGIERSARSHGFHLFRHTAASIVAAQTGGLKQAQKLLRHTNISTTGDIYVHVDENDGRAAVEALASSVMSNCGLVVAEGLQ